MLDNLDVLIGVSVVMLVLSLIVTIIGQAVASVGGLRGTNLLWGLSMLIQQLHADRFGSPPANARFFKRDLNDAVTELVTAVLSHPLLSGSKAPLGRWQLATAVRFDEVVKVVVMLGSRASANSDMKWLAENNHLTEPWFNSMMDRVSQRFTMHMRIYTVVISALLVAFTGVDTLHVLQRLRNDASLRSGLVAAAQSISQSESANLAGRDATEEVAKVQAFTTSVVSNLPKDQRILTLLRDDPWPATDWRRLPGMLLTIALLSLGAPFWFNMLKNLVALRPIVAKKEQQEQQGAASVPDIGDGIRWQDLPR